jgi:hypothetical protein
LRRRSIDPWEVEAMERVETLRRNLDELINLGRAVAEGSVDVEEFFESFNAEIANAREVVDWLPEWRRKAKEKVSPQAMPSYAVLSNCLPLLADSTQLFACSIAVLAISPDPSQLRDGDTEVDGAVAADGLRLSHEVATAALAIIQETRTLKRKDGRTAQAVLALQRRAERMVMVLPFARSRLQALAVMQGLLGGGSRASRHGAAKDSSGRRHETPAGAVSGETSVGRPLERMDERQRTWGQRTRGGAARAWTCATRPAPANSTDVAPLAG